MPHTIVIAGYYGFGNTGDELILEAMVRDLRGELPDVDLVVLSGKPRQTSGRYRVNSVSWRDIKRIEQSVRDADLVILGSGGIFHDYWGFDNSAILTSAHIGISFYTSVALLASIHHKPLMLYAVGVGPLVSEKGRAHVKAIAEQAALITVRDRHSGDILRKLGIPTKRFTLAADPAAGLTFEQYAGKDERKRLGVVLRNWNVGVDPQLWEKCIAEAVDSFLDSHSEFDAVFIPFQDESDSFLNDQGVARRISKQLRNAKRTRVIEKSLSPHLKGDHLASCDLILGMRLHSLVVASSNGIPMVGLGYDPKVASYLQQLGLGRYSVALSDVSSSMLFKLLDDALNHKDEIRTLLTNLKPGMVDLGVQSAQLAGKFLSKTGVREDKSSAELTGILGQTALSLMEALEASRSQIKELKQLVQTHSEREAESVKRVSQFEESLEQKELEIKNLSGHLAELEEESLKLLAQKQTAVNSLNQQIELLKTQNLEGQKQQDFLAQELEKIKGSRGWKLVWGLWQVRLFLAPQGSKREEMVRGLLSVSGRTFKSAALTIRGLLRVLTGWTGSKRSVYADCFLRYKKMRSKTFTTDLSQLQVPCRAGLVSIVMPLYNGSKYIHEAVESILGQTYTNFELIIVDDGSTDDSGSIADGYAGRDARVRVIHQPNRKLPAALNAGFELAQGEYLTWTSDDNIIKPNFLQKLVACLEQHPRWDMAYANMDIIGEDGKPLLNSLWYEGYQIPHGSEHIYLPGNAYELNTYANNFIGGAFLYRKRVHHLLAGYSRWQFTREDYDYWMQVNALLTLRHSDFMQPVYNYRFHERSLTSQDEIFQITRDRKFLMVFDDFRRDFFLMPIIWVVQGSGESQSVRNLTDKVKNHAVKRGGIVLSQEEFNRLKLPRLFLPVIYLQVVQDLAVVSTVAPSNCMSAVLYFSYSDGLTQDGNSQIMLLQYDKPSSVPVEPAGNPNTFSSADLGVLLDALDIQVRSRHLKQIENEIANPPQEKVRLTVIVCTYKRNQSLEDTLISLAKQTAAKQDFEVVVVDNNPGDSGLDETFERIRNAGFLRARDRLRLVHCPVLGLSYARNAGIAEARGDIILFLDDDTVADADLVEQYLTAFDAHSEMGVIGGHITLKRPDKINMVWKEGWERYWSQFITGYRELTKVTQWWEFPWGANWCTRRKVLLQIGGFRGRYGRRGNDFSGGEEIIAACLVQQLGYSIGILPQAHVLHQVDPSRFTLEHLKKTIFAGVFIHYQEQRDLYLPSESHYGNSLSQICKAIWRAAACGGRSGNETGEAERLEASFKLDAQFKLLGKRLRNWVGGN